MVLVSCTNKPKNNFKIIGEIKGIAGCDILLMYEDPYSEQGFKIDSLKTDGDTFIFEGITDSIRIAMIAVDNPELVVFTGGEAVPPAPVQFFIEPNGVIKIKGEVDKMNLSYLSGTQMNEQMNKLIRYTEKQQEYVDSLVYYLYKMENSGFDTSDLHDTIRAEYMKLIDLHADFVEQNPDLDISSFILQMYLSQYCEIDRVIELYYGLSEKVKSNLYGRAIGGMMMGF